jgi:membrane protease YdiL (CAAX protease family)
MRGFYKDSSPLSKFGLVTLVALLSLLLFLIISAVLAIPFFGIESFSSLMSSSLVFDQENLALLKYFQIMQSIGMFIVPSFILALLFGDKIGVYLKLNRKPFLFSAFLATVIVLSASPMINLLGLWNAEMSLPDWMSGIEEWMRNSEDAAAKMTELFVHTETLPGLLLNVFMIGLIPAVGEELLFRGVIQRIFTEWSGNKHVAIWLTAILFSALHFQFYGFVPRAILGAMFGYLLILSGNLWLPVIAHFINNTMAVLAYYFYDKGVFQSDPDTFGVGTKYQIAALFSIVVVIVLFIVYQRYEKRNRLVA